MSEWSEEFNSLLSDFILLLGLIEFVEVEDGCQWEPNPGTASEVFRRMFDSPDAWVGYNLAIGRRFVRLEKLGLVARQGRVWEITERGYDLMTDAQDACPDYDDAEAWVACRINEMRAAVPVA